MAMKCLMRRVRGKQPPPAAKATARRRGRKTVRAAVIRDGGAPKARKAFALFVKDYSRAEKGQPRSVFAAEMQRLGKQWRSLPQEEKKKYELLSRREFAEQQAALKMHGAYQAPRRSAKQQAARDQAEGASRMTKPLKANKLGTYQLTPTSSGTSTLGAGSYGKVMYAQGEDGRRFALKVFSKSDGEEDLRQEASRYEHLQKTLQLEDQCWFPTLADSFPDAEPMPWFVLTFGGVSLAEVLQRRGAQPTAETWSMATQLRSALRALHKVELLHLDLKPSNILWCSELGQLKLTDFGLSEFVRKENGKEASPSPRFTCYVTANYRPPELFDAMPEALSKLLTPAVDMWSWGCVVFEVASGVMLMSPINRCHSLKNTVRCWCSAWPYISKPAVTRAEHGQAEAAATWLRARAGRAGPWTRAVLGACSPDPKQRSWQLPTAGKMLKANCEG